MIMKKQFYKLYEVTHALLLTLLLSIVGVRAFCSASFVTNVSSTLTGESGIVAFTCPEVGTLYNAWVDAGRPGKIKVSGEIDRNDICRVTHNEYNISYLDLSDANINACTANDYSHSLCKENYLKGEWLGWDYWPSILVLPDNLEELDGNGEIYEGGISKIYSRKSVPCKTYLSYSCFFYVPAGSRQAWKSMTTTSNKVTFVDGPDKTINVKTAGTLQNYLTSEEIETINILTVDGSIDARDFKTIKGMKNLVILNIYAKIVAYEGSLGPNTYQKNYKAREIPAYLFQNHQNLESVRLSAMEYGYIIGNYAFDGCVNLSSFDDGYYGVISLGDFCFRNTTINNTILLLGKTCKRYDDDNFSSSFSLPYELNYVGKNPFFGSKAWFSNGYCVPAQNDYDSTQDSYYVITDYTILPDYFNNNYPQGLYRHPYRELLSKDESILYTVRADDNYNLVLTNKVTTLADYAISGLNIKTVDLKSVTDIGDGFLYQCPILSEIICDNNTFKALDGVLYTTDKKTLVRYPCAKDEDTYTIPSTIEKLSKCAFEGSNNLKSLIVEATTPPMIESNTFENVPLSDIILYVPYGCKTAYKNASYWNEFKNILEIVPPSPTIEFADANVKNICVTNWDTDGDGELCEAEAATVTYLGEEFKKNTQIASFDELKYFTGLKYISDYAFSGCTNLTSITIPNSVTTIGYDAFSNTAWYNNQPDGLVYAGKFVYKYKGTMSENTAISIKDGSLGIAGGAFSGCNDLTSLIIPNSVTTLPRSMGCGAIEHIHVPSSVNWIGLYSINKCKTVIIEDGNNELRLQDRNDDEGYWDGVFSGVKKLYVGRNTDCSGFSSAGQVFTISGSPYTQLTDVTFGPQVTSAFTGYDFRSCDKVTSVTCLAKQPFTSPDFYQIPQTAVLKVPLGSKQYYESATGWSDFKSIEEVTEVSITMSGTEMVYSSDFDLDFSHVEGLKAYVVSDYDDASSTITLKHVQIVPAGKGVILKGAEGTYTVPCTNVEAGLAGLLCGTISGKYINSTQDDNVNFVFDKVNHVFKAVDIVYGCQLSRNEAYLSLPTSSVSGNGSIMTQYVDTGDINTDGQTTAQDASLVLQHVAGKTPLNDNVKKAADVNGDGEVTAQDASLILQKVAGK